MGRYVRTWFLAGFLSLLVAQLTGMFFCNTVLERRWSPELQGNVPEFTHVDYRFEGWARSWYGRYGINAIDDVTAVDVPKVLLWGTSFVAGRQVPDDLKMAQQLTKMFVSSGTDCIAVGLGLPGSSMADWYRLMPHYESLIPDVVMHVIVINGLRDVCPQGDAGRFASFEFGDDVRVIPPKPEMPMGTAEALGRKILSRSGFLWTLVSRYIMEAQPLRFMPGPVSMVEASSGFELETTPSDEDIVLLFGLMRSRTDAPVLVVYCPRLPSIDSDRVVMEPPAEDAGMDAVRKACEMNGLGYLDMTNRFIEFHRSTGRLPQGFHNSIPGRGHFNRDGHRLVAEAIHDYMQAHHNAVHTD